MSETTFDFGDEDDRARKIRRLKVAGGITALGAMAAVAASSFVFTAPAADDTASALAAASSGTPFDEATGEPAVEGAPGDQAAVDAEPPRTFEIFSTKNPFTPLVDETPEAAPAPDTVESGGTTVIPAPTVIPTGSNEPRPAERVSLLEVSPAADGRVVASVKVNDTVHQVGQDDVFATSYKVVSLAPAEKCGQFLFGDDAFQLCAGQELLK